MKKKFLKRLLAVSLAGLMTVPLAGCGNEDASAIPESSSVEQSGTSSQVSSEEPSEDPVDIRIFSAYSEADEAESSKFLVSELEKALNINLVRDEIPSSAYQEKLQLAMSDGDYPDVFIFNSHEDSLLLSAIDNGLIISIDEYLETGNYPNLMKYTYDEAWEAVKIRNDGMTYLVPRTTVSRVDGFVIREDWLNNLGIQIASDNTSVTKEEFLNIMKAFCENDPDGDGLRNTYGIVYTPDSSGNLFTICDGAFNCLGWQESNGDYSYMAPQYEIGNENYLELLEYNQQLYKYAHPDGIVSSDSSSFLTAGQIGTAISFAGHVSNKETEIRNVNPDAECTYLAGVVNDDGILQGMLSYPGIWGGLAITKNCENPEKVLEMVDWLLSDQAWEYALYGIPDVTYEKEADGTCRVIDADLYKSYKVNGIWGTIIARRKEDANFFIDLSLPEEQYSTIKGWIDIAVAAAQFERNYGKQPAITTDTAFIEAENTRKEAITKIIMGAMSVDEYESVLQNWYSKGGETYIEQMNEIILGIGN